MSKDSKIAVKYRVIRSKSPATGKVAMRPVIVRRQTYSLERTVDFALNGGYIRGHKEDVCGVITGLFAAIKELDRSGVAVRLGKWIRFHGELKGSVNDDGRVDNKNSYRMVATPLKDFHNEIDSVRWSYTVK